MALLAAVCAALTAGLFDIVTGSLLTAPATASLAACLVELALTTVAAAGALAVCGAAVYVAVRCLHRDAGAALGCLAALLTALVTLHAVHVTLEPTSDPHALLKQLAVLAAAGVIPLVVGRGVTRLWRTPTDTDTWSAAFLALPWTLGIAGIVIVAAARSGLAATAPASAGIIAAVTIAAVVAWRRSRRPLDPPRRVRAYAIAAGLAVLLGVSSAFKPAPTTARADVAPGNPQCVRQVILLTVDALRADAIATYADTAPPTPACEALAADSIVFERAYSPAPWTLPAFCSMMTALPPEVHRTTQFSARLAADHVTLAEQMQAAGYLTAAVGDNLYLMPAYGMDQGFARYEFYPQTMLNPRRSLGRRLEKALRHDTTRNEADTPYLTDRAITWLEGHRDQAFFFWLHYFDPHLPYTPPAQYLPPGTPPPRIGTALYHDKFHSIRSGYFVPTAEEVAWIRGLYDGEVRHVDTHVARLLAALKRLGIYEDALIIFTSDHGEEFWEHGGFEHGHSVHEEVVRVPLMVKLPGASRTGRISTVVSTGSILPTVLDLCGVAQDTAPVAYPSLRPYWTGAAPPEAPVASTGCGYYEDQLAIRTNAVTYIKRLLSGRECVYDAARDPHELLPTGDDTLVDAARELLSVWHARVADLRKQVGRVAQQGVHLDDRMLQRLRSFGYVE